MGCLVCLDEIEDHQKKKKCKCCKVYYHRLCYESLTRCAQCKSICREELDDEYKKELLEGCNIIHEDTDSDSSDSDSSDSLDSDY